MLRSPANAASRFVIKTESLVPVERRAPAAPARPPIEKFESPRIEALRTAVKQGRRDAVAVFWRAVEQEGAPIIERVDGNSYDDLVTFLWRGAASTRNVLILWAPFTIAKPSEYAMSQIGGSGVWYRTLSIRRGARFAYQLSPNDPMTFDDDAAIERSAAAQVDPLNPRKWFGGPFDSPHESSSVVEMPDARPQPYSTRREGVPAGRLEPARITSALLGNTRTLTIYTPPAYRKDGPPNGLLVVFDENAYLTMVPTPVILDNLIAEGRIPPMVAVLVGNPDPAARARELPPNPAFASFLNDELVPWIRQRYHVTRDPSKVVVAGSSFGGIASVYAGLRHPETFGAILCQSGSFWWADPKPAPYAEPNFLAREFIRSPKLPLRFYLDAGAFEVDLSGQGNGILLPSRHMRDVLLARGYSVRYQENIGGHDYLSWRGSFADGLIALMAPAE
ncbi:MAG: DUF3327 domain-containing protein [Acidobacteria bacterium]|nr:DUF3327 domain-containing protein [Acidobacteriota bacterium]